MARMRAKGAKGQLSVVISDKALVAIVSIAAGALLGGVYLATRNPGAVRQLLGSAPFGLLR